MGYCQNNNSENLNATVTMANNPSVASIAKIKPRISKDSIIYKENIDSRNLTIQLTCRNLITKKINLNQLEITKSLK